LGEQGPVMGSGETGNRLRTTSADRRLLVSCATYLAAIWVFASAPFVSVLREYGSIHLCSGISLEWFIATLYKSFFIYPVVLGGLSMGALLLPLATSISLTKSSKAIYLLTGFYAVTTAIISFLEFRVSPGIAVQASA
jgi:hypothetical protein